MISEAELAHCSRSAGQPRARRLACLCILVLVLVSCSRSQPELVFSGPTMGTTYQVKVVPGSTPFPSDAAARIAALLQSLDAAMSTYKSDSELNRLNRQPVGEPFAVSPDLLRVLVLSKLAFQITGGAFDPTLGPLVDLWGFGPVDTGDRVPDEGELKAALENIGFGYLAIDEKAASVIKTRPIRIDLSGIVPGYAADRVSELLDDVGLTNYLVDLGGELRGSGRNGKGEPWRVGIEVPAVERGGVERVLALADVGVATSGDYRNYFERDGVHYSHIIDPTNGRPVSNGVASTTVIAPTGAEADALSTGFMVLGKDASLKIADERGIALLLLVKEGGRFVEYGSAAFAPYLTENAK